jgi:hypothetical protein
MVDIQGSLDPDGIVIVNGIVHLITILAVMAVLTVTEESYFLPELHRRSMISSEVLVMAALLLEIPIPLGQDGNDPRRKGFHGTVRSPVDLFLSLIQSEPISFRSIPIEPP